MPAGGVALCLPEAAALRAEAGARATTATSPAAGGTGAGATAAGVSASTGPSPAARLDAEMGYGLTAFAGTLTPYGGLALSEGGAHGYRLGARFGLDPELELGLEGERRESRSERAEHSLMLRGRMHW